VSAAGETPQRRSPQSAASDDVASDAGARLTPLRELQLVEAFRGGDVEALRPLLEGYERRIYAVCYRMLRDPESAADLTQDTLIKVLEGLSSYDGRSQLSTWVIRVAMNCCLSHLRKERLRRHQPLISRPTEQAADVRTDPAAREQSGLTRVEKEERHSAVFEALAVLEPDTRALLVLRDVQGLEYQQIAEVLDLPIGTVKSRLFRARQALRTALEHRGL
jgi:RNA polymerase sigma-70 factor (ECF subfamily)